MVDFPATCHGIRNCNDRASLVHEIKRGLIHAHVGFHPRCDDLIAASFLQGAAQLVGSETGKMHFSPPERMEELLRNEGIEVKNDKIVNFESLFWDPSKELEI